jgi:enterochelin esterase family protein
VASPLLPALAVALATVGASPVTPPRDPVALSDALKHERDKDGLADAIRQWFGPDELKRGPRPKISDLTVAWAIEAPGVERGKEPRVVSQDGSFTLPLKRVGKTDVYAAVATLPERAGFLWTYEVNGTQRGGWRDIEVYTTPPENRYDPNVPHGKLTQMPPWKSQIFAGTTRDWWVYVPAQYTPDKPAAVMVFQDGGGEQGGMPVVFDNLIAKGDLPPIVGVFINPGKFDDGRSDRSVEYDTLSDKYARFLLEEILPEVEKTVKLRHDAAGRAIAGVSSGGICAFTVAWERPNEFSKVLSAVGSFVNLQGGPDGASGGNTYPARIRREIGWNHEGKPKPIRVYLSDGANDLDNAAGNWPLSSQQMAKALAYGGYDYKFVFGNGFHNHKFGMALMPESLRWLWRDEVKKP